MHARWVAAGNDAPAETGIIAPDNALTTAAANPAGIEAGCARMADDPGAGSVAISGENPKPPFKNDLRYRQFARRAGREQYRDAATSERIWRTNSRSYRRKIGKP